MMLARRRGVLAGHPIIAAPPATVPYSEGFETSDGGFVPTSPATWTRLSSGGHTGTYSMELAPGAAAGRDARKTITGLTIGVSYTLTAWAARNSTSSTTVTIGIVGIGDSSALTAGANSYAQLTYVFTATATSHDILLKFVASSSARRAYFDDIAMVVT